METHSKIDNIYQTKQNYKIFDQGVGNNILLLILALKLLL